MTDKLVVPYYILELYGKVQLHPHQMNNSIRLNLKQNLKSKLVGKCDNSGFIMNIYKILDYNDNTMSPEDLSASCIYNVKYAARMCKPVVYSNIICKIEQTSKVLIKSSNGPIICITKTEDLNDQHFMIDNDDNIIVNEENRALKEGDYVVVNIKKIIFFKKDRHMKMMGTIDRIPTQEEVEKYFYSPVDEEDKEEYDKYVESEGDNKIIEDVEVDYHSDEAEEVEQETMKSSYIDI